MNAKQSSPNILDYKSTISQSKVRFHSFTPIKFLYRLDLSFISFPTSFFFFFFLLLLYPFLIPCKVRTLCLATLPPEGISLGSCTSRMSSPEGSTITLQFSQTPCLSSQLWRASKSNCPLLTAQKGSTRHIRLLEGMNRTNILMPALCLVGIIMLWGTVSFPGLQARPSRLKQSITPSPAVP